MVRKEAVATGIFPLGGIRVRASMRALCIADGGRISAFSTWCCGSARAAPRHKAKGRRTYFQGLVGYLDPVFANSKFALSFDMQINAKETS